MAPLYRALTMLAHLYVMKNRDNIGAVIKGLQRDHGLLAAYLEATDKIDRRALHKREVIGQTPRPIGVLGDKASTGPQPPKLIPVTPFVFRRTNLVRVL